MVLSEISNYLEDDWDDNALSGRTSPEEGYFLHPSDGLIGSDVEGGDALKGVYRPDWSIVNGTPSTSGGELILSENSAVKTPSRAYIGTWEIEFQVDATPSVNNEHRFNFINLDLDTAGSNTYHVWVNWTDADYVLRKVVSGTYSAIISATWSPDTVEHIEKVTRDSYGNFELFLDGTSKGTGTDTDHMECKTLWVNNGFDNVSMSFDNFIVR